MKRLHLVELEDLGWFPAVLRDGGTAYLEFVARRSGLAAALTPVLSRVIVRVGITEIVDLCSGSGGPVREIAAALAEQGHAVTVWLTDRYPNVSSLDQIAREAPGRILIHPRPVDATEIPEPLAGMRTFFNAFHHFRPEQARAILAEAVRKRAPIGVFEVVRREPMQLFAILLAPLFVTLSVPFWRPFRWRWLLLTWVLPLTQLFVLWDGVVSWLRVYSDEELLELTASVQASDWEWEIERFKLGSFPAYGTCLVGWPRSPPGN